MKCNFSIGALALLLTVSGCASNEHRFKKASPQAMAQTNMQLSIEYMKLGKLAESRDFIERALSEDSENANVQMTSGLVYERLKEIPRAERGYAAAYRLGRKDPNILNAYAGFLCRNGKPLQGEKLFVEAASDPIYQTPEVALVNAGVCTRGTGDLLDAEKYFNRALSLQPNLPEALLQLGNIEFDRGDAAQAAALVRRYLAVNPATAEVLWLGVRAERKLGNSTGAAAYARRVQVEFPNSEQARMMRSGVER